MQIGALYIPIPVVDEVQGNVDIASKALETVAQVPVLGGLVGSLAEAPMNVLQAVTKPMAQVSPFGDGSDAPTSPGGPSRNELAKAAVVNATM